MSADAAAESPSLGAAFWNDRYHAGDTGWDLGEPSPPFVALDQDGTITPCRVAVPGCGNGWEVCWLAQRGYRVTGIDFAPRAIHAARARVCAAEVTADFVEADLFHLPSALDGVFDLVLEQTCLCAIDPARRPEYVGAVHRLLAPGGRLIALFYACKGSGGPPFSITPDQVRALFGGCFQITSLAPTPHSHTRRRGEEWLGVLTGA